MRAAPPKEIRVSANDRPLSGMDRTIANMRSRIERCRRLASETFDERAAKILLDMAKEGEADLIRYMVDEGIDMEVPPEVVQQRPLQS
jgi:hypothetical protein